MAIVRLQPIWYDSGFVPRLPFRVGCVADRLLQFTLVLFLVAPGGAAALAADSLASHACGAFVPGATSIV
jgi:hypothetical protein